MPFGRESRGIKFGNKPHLLVGTMVGTLATYILFVRHYRMLHSDGGEPAALTRAGQLFFLACC